LLERAPFTWAAAGGGNNEWPGQSHRQWHRDANNFGPNPAFAAPGQYIAFGHPAVSEDSWLPGQHFFFKIRRAAEILAHPTVRDGVLRITGGCDLAEPFRMSHTGHSSRRSFIDEEHPGQLKMSEGEYDQRVAGIVSGANGHQSRHHCCTGGFDRRRPRNVALERN
jgi:hypothetical protein